jgi:Uma2 family endonuclease
LIEDLCLERHIEYLGIGSKTWLREDLKKGMEPDEAYYIGNEARMRGKPALDLRVDAPPDLAVEVVVIHDVSRRLGIAAALHVREI